MLIVGSGSRQPMEPLDTLIVLLPRGANRRPECNPELNTKEGPLGSSFSYAFYDASSATMVAAGPGRVRP